MKKYEGDPDILALFKTTAQAQLTKVNNALLAVEKEGASVDRLKLMRGEIHTLKGDSRMIGLEAVGGAAHTVEDRLAELEAAGPGQGAAIVKRIFALLDAIDKAIGRLPEEMVELDAEPGVSPAEKISAGETPVGEKPARRKSGLAAEEPVSPPEAPAVREDDTEIISLPVRKIEDLVQKSSAFPQYFNKFNFILAQLEKLKTSMEDNPDPSRDAKEFGSLLYQFSHELSFYDLGSRQFQSEITKLKLVPLSVIFDQFPRLVRDVAENTKKSITLTVKGKEAELDKTVVLKLKNVLIHLLRNAVDHGIEEPKAREKAGKLKEGRIVLSAHNRGDLVEVEIADDGAGLDLELIRRTAVEKGLVAGEKAVALGPDEIIPFIFAPGFSTKQVGSFSGRGVGLNVVAQTVKELNGAVAVKTMAGRGSTFTVSLPLISSFIPMTVFLLDERLFGIPSSYVRSVVRVRESDLRFIGGAAGDKVIAVDGADVPLIDLNAYFGFGPESREQNKNVIIVRNQDEMTGLVVREIIYEKKMIIRKTDWLVRTCPVVIGAVLSGRERAIPIINVPELFQKLKETAGGVSKVKARRGEKDFRLKNVLLVEDSTVSRTRQRDILESRDLNVFEAANGKEALALLEKQPFDAVITDIEMPVMNGLEFIRRTRARREFARLPIIVMSSYSDNIDALRALGVNTFVNKTNFTAHRLIEALRAEDIN